MAIEEGSPGLRGRLPLVYQVRAHARLADVDAELEQFAMNARRTPPRIFTAHLADQIANLQCDCRTSSLPFPNLPRPEYPESPSVPCNHSVWLHDDKRRPPVPPYAGKPDPEQTVRRIQSRTLDGAAQNSELVTQRNVLKLDSSSAFEQR